MSELVEKSSVKVAGGSLTFYRHHSSSCNAEMNFSLFLPKEAKVRKVPVLIWLSGLTCTEENFMVKAGAQKFAAKLGLAILAPDTSPRGLNLPGEHDDWDFGSGAGFYVNATEEPYASHYRMYDYVVNELPLLCESHFSLDMDRVSISGHSMGGHGALMIALRNPNRFRSVSAFSPICAPMQCPWGEKAFSRYLGPDTQDWADYDTCALLQRLDDTPHILVDQGTSDNFLSSQLKPELLMKVCTERNHDLQIRMQPGYDHSYYFIASFIDEHLDYHASHLFKD